MEVLQIKKKHKLLQQGHQRDWGTSGHVISAVCKSGWSFQ